MRDRGSSGKLCVPHFRRSLQQRITLITLETSSQGILAYADVFGTRLGSARGRSFSLVHACKKVDFVLGAISEIEGAQSNLLPVAIDFFNALASGMPDGRVQVDRDVVTKVSEQLGEVTRAEGLAPGSARSEIIIDSRIRGHWSSSREGQEKESNTNS